MYRKKIHSETCMDFEIDVAFENKNHFDKDNENYAGKSMR